MTSARTQGASLESGYSTCLSVPTCRVQKNHPARSLRHHTEWKYCTSSATGQKRCKKSASVTEGTGRRSATSAQPGNPREPGLREVVGDYRSDEREYCVFYLMFLKMTIKERDFARVSGDVRSGVFEKQFESGSLPRCTVRANASFGDAREA